MTVTVDSTGAGNKNTSTVTAGTNLSTSWSHTVSTTDVNTLAIVGIGFSVSSNTTSFTMTGDWGGTAMTFGGGVVQGSGTSRNVTGFFKLFNPPAGTKTVTINTGTEGTRTQVAGNSVAYNGCSTDSPYFAWYASTSPIAYSNTGHRAIAMLSNGAQITAVSHTQIYNTYTSVAGVGDAFVMQDAVGPSGYPNAGTVAFTFTGTSTNPGAVVLSIAPVHRKVSTLVDNFNTADTATWVSRLGTYGTNNPLTTGNQLVVNCTNNGTNWDGISTLTKGYYDFIDSSMVVQLVQPPAKTGSNTVDFEIGIKSYYSVSGGGGYSVDWLYENAGAGSATLYMRQNNNGTLSNTSVAYSATNHKWLRIRSYGGSNNVYWDTSPDGYNWTNQRTIAASPVPLNSCYLYMDGHVSDTNFVNVILDNYSNPPYVGNFFQLMKRSNK